MRVLITNHQLLPFSGSDVFTYTIAKHLTLRGHDVTVCARVVDETIMLPWFKKAGVRVVRDCREILPRRVDVIHGHHNCDAMAAHAVFPRTPLVFLSHGVLEYLEQPPIPSTNVARYLAVSEEVYEHLGNLGIRERPSLRRRGYSYRELFRNPVDSGKFAPQHPINPEPKNALVLSNRVKDKQTRIIRAACDRSGIDLRFVGNGYGVVHQDVLPDHINQVDIVFTLGRGAIEAMLCGRVPVIYDYGGGDGMVTPDNLQEIATCNFSGRRYRRQFGVRQLVGLLQGYRQEHGMQLRAKALELFDAALLVKRLEQIYEEVQSKGVAAALLADVFDRVRHG